MKKVFFFLLTVLLFFVVGCDSDSKTEEETRGYVTFWFDDGLLSTYEKAFPVFEEKGWNAVLAVVGSRVVMSEKIAQEGDKIMSWENVKEMEEKGWEISNHSMTHEKLGDEKSLNYLKMEVLGSKEVLENYGFSVESFTFPHGDKGCDKARDMVQLNYFYWRSTVSEINSLPPERHLKCLFVTECMDRKKIREWINKAEEEEGWLIIVLHSIINNPVGWWQQTPEQFAMIVEEVEESSLEVVLPRDIFELFAEEIRW